MKTLSLLFALSLLTTPLCAFARLGGAGDAGGGHAFSSTPEEVREYVYQVPHRGGPITKDLLSSHVYLDVFQALNPDYAPNETVKRVLVAMKRVDDTQKINVVSLPIEPKDACYDHDGLLSDGATTIGKVKAPVCINVNSLARLPSESLRLEILALMYHEFTHQLGFGENEAVEMQNYARHYLPLAIALIDTAGGGGTPLRVGGEITLRAQDGTWTKFQCTSREQYDSTPKGGVIYKSAVTLLFPGQAALVRGLQYGDQGVGCSDLPRLACQPSKLTQDETTYAKAVVVGGSMRWTDDALGLDTSDPAVVLQELQRRGVCR